MGDAVEVGGSYNPFFGFYENVRSYPVTLLDGTVVRVPAIKFLTSVQNGEVTPGNLPVMAVEIAQHYLMLARELLFEEVRLREGPHLPSRKTCLWASDTAEQARFWLSELGGNGRILRLQVLGARHLADSNLLLGDSEPLAETYQKAALYWQSGLTNNPKMETLICGKVTVLEEII